MIRPKRIVIVGGGSSGWMAAAYLDAALNQPDHKVADITLVESPDVPRIGVGEATIPSINHILAVIGIDEVELLKRANGTFKHAIKYVNWLNGNGDAYYHAFGRRRFTPIDYSTTNWLKGSRSVPFSETISAQPSLCEAHIGPRALPGDPEAAQFTYAFHMNALNFADYLCEIATSRGVQHHRDHMIDIEMADNGDIAAIKTRAGLRIEGDLFIDCTGFAALLIEKQLGIKWVDCSQWLLCDRATTMHVPYDHHYPGYVRPYTTASALSAGWVWEIPLQDKRSLGYVHSSAFLSDDDAEKEIRRFEGQHSESLDSRIVHFKVGHREKSWARNCIAIGLSSSFIEPLESTGLFLSDLATVMLSEHFPYQDDMAPLAYRFNRIMADRFYEILDFINLHYCLTQRDDTEFWREIGKAERIHDRVKAKLEFWRSKPPSIADFEDASFPGEPTLELPSGGIPGDHRAPVDTAGVFGLSSYEAILYGMDFLRDECDHWYGANRPATQILPPIANRIEIAKQQLPTHADWLQRVCSMPAYPTK